MDQYTRVFDTKTASLCHLLEQGEKLYALDHKPDEKLFSAILGRVRRELDDLEEYVYHTGSSASMEDVLESLERRLARLFFLPTEDAIDYAQNLLCFPNLCLADGAWIFDAPHRPVGLSDFVVIDCTEHVLFHHPFLVGGHFADILTMCSGNSRLLAPARTPGLLLRVPQSDAAWLFSSEQTAMERVLTMLHALRSIAQGQRI